MQIKPSYMPAFLFFIIATVVLVYFFPREKRFYYQFHEGKPWQHELITAPTDFPIYKADNLIELEQDSALSTFRPYYRMDDEAIDSTLKTLREKYNTTWKSQGLSTKSIQYVDKTLTLLYNKGIISTELQREFAQISEINLRNDKVSTRCKTNRFYTVKSAYQYLLDNIPHGVNRSDLVNCDLHRFLAENVTYDEELSNRMREEIIAQIPIVYGVVQAGERIIDRGEIVDHRTYDILNSLRKVSETESLTEDHALMTLIGEALLIILLMIALVVYLLAFKPHILEDKRGSLFLVLSLASPVFITELLMTYYPSVSIYMLPFAIVPIVISVFFDTQTGFWTHVLVVFICSLTASFPYEFIFLQMVAGIIVALSLNDLTQRSQFIRTAMLVFVGYLFSYAALVLHHEGSLDKIDGNMALYFTINLILLLFTYVFVYILEKMFGYVSSITLIELSNINSPLLKSLAEECPGTFQHSLQVSALASAACEKIGANAQLVRTGALYHDIGKLAAPAFFTENQKSVNPHDALTYEESAKIIIDHVSNGVKMAQKEGLPDSIIDFIRSHHGSGKAKYFYYSWKNANPDKEIDETIFTYPGPNPFSKEMTVMMMADSVEAASRSLKAHTEEEISNLVHNIINAQIQDGLLKESPITFHDIEVIKGVFIHKLKIIFHTRISYPNLKK